MFPINVYKFNDVYYFSLLYDKRFYDYFFFNLYFGHIRLRSFFLLLSKRYFNEFLNL